MPGAAKRRGQAQRAAASAASKSKSGPSDAQQQTEPTEQANVPAYDGGSSPPARGGPSGGSRAVAGGPQTSSPMSPTPASGSAPSRDPARDPEEPQSVKDLNRKLDLPAAAFKLDNLVSLGSLRYYLRHSAIIPF